MIIVRFAEIGLKGKNRRRFEDLLIRNIKIHLAPFGPPKIKKAHSRFLLHTTEQETAIAEALQNIPGVTNCSIAHMSTLEMEDIQQTCQQVVANYLQQHPQTTKFRIRTKRSNKQYPLSSTEIDRALGSFLISQFPQLSVQLEDPPLEVGVEIWGSESTVYLAKQPGISGLPVDPQQRVVSLLSGGIDSPVASWMMMRRGCTVIYTYFHSFPFIGEQSKEKVIDLVKQLSQFQPHNRLYAVSFTEIQKAIKAHCPENLRTVLYRRYMHRISTEVASQEKAKALVTGDSLGQVASQTLDNMFCISEGATLPILRPLVGLDKNEITNYSRRIGTYPISIQDFPDCCTVFQPAHPATAAKLDEVQEAEAALKDLEKQLIQEALEGAQILDL